MTFAEVSRYLFQGHAIGRTIWKKAQNLCFNKYNLLTRADGGEIRLYGEDFIATDWKVYPLPEGNIGTKNDIR